MLIADLLLPQFDVEMGTTRRVLAVVPEDRPGWQPHPKSMPIGRLATHLVDLPRWVPLIVEGRSSDGAGGRAFEPTPFENKAQLLSAFDQHVAAARAAIAGQADGVLMEPWTFRIGGVERFTQPRFAALRSFVLSHMIHHRGQLTVYLRLNDVPLPSVYGPTADQG